MSLLSDVVALADEVTQGLDFQSTVQHYAWTGQDGRGNKTYAAPVSRLAVVDQTVREHRTASGQVVGVKARVTFLRPIAANGAADRKEPLDPRDKILLPDGTTGPIVDVSGPFDAGSTSPLLSDAWIGSGNTSTGG